ncbi:hypothetical protein OGAPHI_006865 [Ogataea philodendri]|uniref:Vacuolar import and degradation protein 27 n=1 Tax=Ogataea philodendri TaxID=1378263 RepID=A0A9P8NVM9_9ASCO|nr:uncharacterized protein OGAPHI_006865 [Ogataea philodendri]KAH3660279.1 hypothetical protein OGAPHI_006865 [Ogataea philodendri]
MNIIKKLLSNANQASNDELILVQSGQLYLLRSPKSPKSENECLFTDVIVSIRETSLPFNYQLSINKAVEAGQDALDDDELDAEDHDDDFDADSTSLKSFLIDEKLRFCLYQKYGTYVIAWKDLDGDIGDMFEFRVSPSGSVDSINQFMLALYKCEYERKYKKSSLALKSDDLKEFVYDRDSLFEDIPDMLSSLRSSVNIQPSGQLDDSDSEDKFEDAVETADSKLVKQTQADVLMYDETEQDYVLKAEAATVKILQTGLWMFSLDVSAPALKNSPVATVISNSIDPVFDFGSLSFTFNVDTAQSVLTWAFQFASRELYESFQQSFTQCLYEATNKTSWVKLKNDEQDFLIDSIRNLNIDEMDVDSESDESEDEESYKFKDGKLFLSDDEDEDDENGLLKRFNAGGVNSGMKMAYKDNLAFVSRGNKLGVFKMGSEAKPVFSTAIENISSASKKGKAINPGNMMLQKGDTVMIIQDKDNKDNLYKMDLEYGKVVEDWQFKKDNAEVPVVNFTSNEKFGELTEDQTFLGVSHQSLFRVDPRLQNKLVDSEFKHYKSKTNFSHIATTEDGYIAASTNNGEIKLYDKLGKNAKTLIPALGDEFIGLTTSDDGRFILATCRKYLLLLDVKIKKGTYKSSLGYERSFGKDSKPIPKKLALRPEHLAYIRNQTGKEPHFTKANFSINRNSKKKEPTAITTSIGPFAVIWNFKKALQNDTSAYSIKRYDNTITTTDFKFNDTSKVIFTLPNEVSMASNRAFKKASDEFKVVESPY